MSGVAPVADLTSVQVRAGAPYFDVEVISDPYVEEPAPYGAAPTERLDALHAAFLRRVEKLHEPFRNPCPVRVLIACGTPAIEPADVCDNASAFWERALDDSRRRLGDATATPSLLEVPTERGQRQPVLEVFRVCTETKSGNLDPEPFAYVAILGFAWLELDFAEVEQRIEELATTVALNNPLYVIGVTDGSRLEAAGLARNAFLDGCQRLRMSVLLAGGLPQRDVPAVSRTPLEPGQGATELAIVPCPPFRPGVGTPGMVRLRIDVRKGNAEIAFNYDLGSDRADRPTQIGQTLASVSRVPASERRLYARVRDILARERPANADFVDRFSVRVQKVWDETGYAALAPLEEKDERFGDLPERLRKTYFLLLLLRERDTGGYDILLNHHTPIRPSSLADWNTLLFPAFREPRDLLERLRNDVTRQAVERAEDLEHAERAHDFAAIVDDFLDEDDRAGEGLWVDQLREVAQTTTRKISPTDGCITEFEYHLVTLLPLVERSGAEGTEIKHRRAEIAGRLVQWLDGLDAVRPPGEQLTPRDIGIEALEAGGAGLRWDPGVELVQHPRTEERRRARKVPPGAVWFPLSEDGEPLWRQCPSIASRNGDVMRWAASELRGRRVDGRFPSGFVLGQSTRGTDAYEIRTEQPFEGEPESTCSALRNVMFKGDFDLGDRPAYPAPAVEICRVFLVKRPVTVGGRTRHEIAVFPADPADRDQPDRHAFADRKKLGSLRPVQRYVLTPGLIRAKELYQQVIQEVKDPWGFASIVKGTTPKEVALTPPIIEALHPDDWDECGGADDFVVADGNHRVVQMVWTHEAVLPAVALRGELPQPYYAHPFGALEWGATADNELKWTPNQASKYLARKVDRNDLKKELRNKRDSELFRRYFRDYETGFGYMGGQGGQFAG